MAKTKSDPKVNIKELIVTYNRKFCVGSLDRGNFTSLETGVTQTIVVSNGDDPARIINTAFNLAKDTILDEVMGFMVDIRERNKNPLLVRELTEQVIKELGEYNFTTAAAPAPTHKSVPQTATININDLPGMIPPDATTEDILARVKGKSLPAKEVKPETQESTKNRDDMP